MQRSVYALGKTPRALKEFFLIGEKSNYSQMGSEVAADEISKNEKCHHCNQGTISNHGCPLLLNPYYYQCHKFASSFATHR